MSDSRRCSSADFENMCKKITKIYSQQGAASKMFRDTIVPIQCQAILISHFELHILPKLSKTVGVLNAYKCIFSKQIYLEK